MLSEMKNPKSGKRDSDGDVSMHDKDRTSQIVIIDDNFMRYSNYKDDRLNIQTNLASPIKI